jgi:hypothetical protein
MTDNNAKSIEILSRYSKEEMLEYFRFKNTFYFQPVQEKYLLFVRWYKAQEAYLADDRAHNDLCPDMTERDRLARLFNASSDFDEKVNFAKQMKPYEEKFAEWISGMKKLEEIRKWIDKLHKEYEEFKD